MENRSAVNALNRAAHARSFRLSNSQFSLDCVAITVAKNSGGYACALYVGLPVRGFAVSHLPYFVSFQGRHCYFSLFSCFVDVQLGSCIRIMKQFHNQVSAFGYTRPLFPTLSFSLRPRFQKRSSPWHHFQIVHTLPLQPYPAVLDIHAVVSLPIRPPAPTK